MMTIQAKPHKITGSKNDTVELTQGVVEQWKAPPFQRPLTVNAKVLACVGEIKTNGGVIPGTLTLGVLDRQVYLLDGQHRVHAWKLSELTVGYADVRYLYVDSMAEMAAEFDKLNSRLVNMRPDDHLRALDESNVHLQHIRRRCPFVGFSFIRRGKSSPIVSMSMLLRCWAISEPETPAGSCGSAVALAAVMTEENAEQLVAFLTVAYAAWKRDEEYLLLWRTLNLTLCMWLYRRTVIHAYSPNSTRFTKEQFQKSLLALSADSGYLDYLVGRNLGDRDRSPTFGRIKAIITTRMEQETGAKIRLPQPAWAHGGGRVGRKKGA